METITTLKMGDPLTVGYNRATNTLTVETDNLTPYGLKHDRVELGVDEAQIFINRVSELLDAPGDTAPPDTPPIVLSDTAYTAIWAKKLDEGNVSGSRFGVFLAENRKYDLFTTSVVLDREKMATFLSILRTHAAQIA